MSLTDQIRNATTQAEIDGLLAEGEKFENASDQTKKKWARVARQQKEEIEALDK